MTWHIPVFLSHQPSTKNGIIQPAILFFSVDTSPHVYISQFLQTWYIVLPRNKHSGNKPGKFGAKWGIHAKTRTATISLDLPLYVYKVLYRSSFLVYFSIERRCCGYGFSMGNAHHAGANDCVTGDNTCKCAWPGVVSWPYFSI